MARLGPFLTLLLLLFSADEAKLPAPLPVGSFRGQLSEL